MISLKEGTNFEVFKILKLLLLDDKISAEDYGETSEKSKKERLKYQDELRELKAQNTDYHTWIKNGINFITNLPERLTD